jgi:hypothetical protein
VGDSDDRIQGRTYVPCKDDQDNTNWFPSNESSEALFWITRHIDFQHFTCYSVQILTSFDSRVNLNPSICYWPAHLFGEFFG